MSAMAELIRDNPGYKKALLAVTVTAGVGACAYFGYRCATRRGKGRPGAGAPPRSLKQATKEESRQEKPVVEKEEKLFTKKETKEIGPVSFSPPSKVETVAATSSKPITDELSTSGTFEKISLAPNESENFEHLTMSQVHPAISLTQEVKDEKPEQDASISSISFLQSETESNASVSILNLPELSQSASMTQSGQSASIITLPATEEEEDFPETSAFDRGIELSKDDDNGVLVAASGVNLKDENDIVVVEASSDDHDSHSIQEETTTTAPVDFDSSRISPVFGHQSYHQVNVEADEIKDFDPAKSHPASIGFEFSKNI